MDEPLDPARCRQLIREILKNGSVSFSTHAREEMDDDDFAEIDVTNVLRAGFPEPGELVNGTWRYRVCTQRMGVVVAFRSKTSLRVVTAWRNKP